jgi:hypothetical protein
MPVYTVCSFLNSAKSSSSRLCHGYRTNTWKHRAEVAIAKLVRENRRVTIMIGGQDIGFACAVTCMAQY